MHAHACTLYGFVSSVKKAPLLEEKKTKTKTKTIVFRSSMADTATAMTNSGDVFKQVFTDGRGNCGDQRGRRAPASLQ